MKEQKSDCKQPFLSEKDFLLRHSTLLQAQISDMNDNNHQQYKNPKFTFSLISAMKEFTSSISFIMHFMSNIVWLTWSTAVKERAFWSWCCLWKHEKVYIISKHGFLRWETPWSRNWRLIPEKLSNIDEPLPVLTHLLRFFAGLLQLRVQFKN